MEPATWLVVGLGNPGPEYEHTPHNLGFMAVDRLALRHGIRVTRPECQALAGIGKVSGKDAILAKPQTFMNVSGGSVKQLLGKYSLGLESLILVYDELAFEWGQIRIRPKGSAAGHNGVSSVIRSTGSDEFIRVRIGVSPGGGSFAKGTGADYLLSPIRRGLQGELDTILDQGSDAIESIIAEGVEKTMTKFNRRIAASE